MLIVKDIMTEDVFVLEANQSLNFARSLMEIKHVRHVPIVNDKNELIGLLTHRDILAQSVSLLADIDEKEQAEIDRNIPIKNIMKTDIESASPDLDLASAIEVLLDHKYGCLPVLSDKVLVGIVTEADFLKLTQKLLKEKNGQA